MSDSLANGSIQPFSYESGLIRRVLISPLSRHPGESNELVSENGTVSGKIKEPSQCSDIWIGAMRCRLRRGLEDTSMTMEALHMLVLMTMRR